MIYTGVSWQDDDSDMEENDDISDNSSPFIRRPPAKYRRAKYANGMHFSSSYITHE